MYNGFNLQNDTIVVSNILDEAWSSISNLKEYYKSAPYSMLLLNDSSAVRIADFGKFPKEYSQDNYNDVFPMHLRTGPTEYVMHYLKSNACFRINATTNEVLNSYELKPDLDFNHTPFKENMSEKSKLKLWESSIVFPMKSVGGDKFVRFGNVKSDTS